MSFLCDQDPCKCRQTFATKYSLESHLKRKAGEKNFGCDQCDAKFVTQQELRQHMTVHNHQFNCDQCEKTFATEAGLKKHSTVHIWYTCDFLIKGKPCGKKFKEPSLLKKHRILHELEKTIPCEQCDKLFKSQANLKSHVKGVHERPFKCDECNNTFGSQRDLDLHINNIHGEGDKIVNADLYIYECDECDSKFRKPSDLEKHKISHSEERLWKCTEKDCDKSFKTESTLKSHINWHKLPFKCDKCEDHRGFGTQWDLNLHINRHHEFNAKFICDYKTEDLEPCGKKFYKTSEYELHMRTHLNLRPSICHMCGAAFRCSSHLYNHLRIASHLNAKIYECDQCDGAFTESSGLKNHKIRMHGEGEVGKNYVCDVGDCTAAFFFARELRKHMASHSDEKNYHCQFEGCEKSFKTLNTLSGHISDVHCEKKYNCTRPDCTFKTSRRLSFEAHIRSHEGLKIYECPLRCGAMFSSSHSVTIHVRLHTGETPYACPDCDEKFVSNSRLKAHHFSFHTPEGQLRKKKEEDRIRKLLERNQISYKPGHTIDFKCMGNNRVGDRCHIDFVLESHDEFGKLRGLIFLEVDEHQHQNTSYSVSCELRRMTEAFGSLVMEGNTIPIKFVRYNPHDFTVDGNDIKLDKRKRQERLLTHIKECDFTKPFSVDYLFYDSTYGHIDVTQDPDYDIGFYENYVDKIITK